MDLEIPRGFSSLIPSGEQGELRAQLNRDRRVVLLSGTPVVNLRSEVSGVSARVCRGGSYGFASMPEVNEDALRRVLKSAEDNAAVLERHLNKGKAARKAVPRAVIAPGTSWIDAEQKAYLDYLRELDAWMAGLPHLTSRRLVVSCDSTEKHLLTGDGAEAHTAIPRCYVYDCRARWSCSTGSSWRSGRASTPRRGNAPASWGASSAACWPTRPWAIRWRRTW